MSRKVVGADDMWQPIQEGDQVMKFGITFQLQTPRPVDADQTGGAGHSLA
jgi:hypothetical protein